MKEKFLLYVSLICSISGLALLYYISQNIELPATSIDQINADDTGKNVKICGQITSKSVSKTQHVFLTLKDDGGSIDIVAFSNSAEALGAYNVKKNDNVCITGQVDEYQNSLEIILKEKIEWLDNAY